MYRHLIALFVGFLMLADTGAAATGQTFTLGSGKKIKILKISPLKIRNGVEFLTLRYVTPAQLNDLETLTREVNEIWGHFIVDVERGGYQGAIISAVKSGKSKKFKIVLKDGVWHMPEPGRPKKLTASLIRAFFERLEWLSINRELDAVLLYVPSDYTLTIVDRTVEGAPVTLDRDQYVALERQILAATTDYKFHRKILDIDLLNKGTKARIKVRVTESGISDGRAFNAVTRSTVILELRDGFMLATRTKSVIEKLTLAGQP